MQKTHHVAHQYIYMKAEVTIITDESGSIPTLFEKNTYTFDHLLYLILLYHL